MRKFVLALILFLAAFSTSAQTVNRARMLSDPNLQTGTTYTFVAQDATRITVFNNNSSVAVTLPSSSTQGFGPGYLFTAQNSGAGTVTITATGGTIKGSATLVLTSGQGCDIYGDGTNYQANCGSGSGGGGGGSPSVGPIGTVQASHGDSTFQVTSILDNGSLITMSEPVSLASNLTVAGSLSVAGTTTFNGDVINKGPNPWIDCRIYGCRAANTAVAPQVPGITATISGGTPTTATLSSASTFQNGDGVTIYGAGATCTLSAPSTPTVTPSLAAGPLNSNIVVNAPAGASSGSYQIVARSAAGCLTAASTAGTTSTAQSTLGPITTSITSATRSGTLMTYTAGTMHTMSVGSYIYITQTSDGTFGGWYQVNTVPDNTHFTVISGFDTASGAGTSSTGGSFVYWNANHVTWSHVAGAFEYYIYKSGTLVGVSKPDDGLYTDGALAWDDFGSVISGQFFSNLFVPTSAPVSSTAAPLVTTILSGAGTTTLTLATPATTAVSGATILLDNAPTVLAAANAAVSTGGAVYIPVSSAGNYVFNSFLQLPSNIQVCLEGNIVLHDTLQIGANQKISGNCISQNNGSTAQFSFSGAPIVFVGRANPGIFGPVSNTNSAYIDHLNIFGTTPNNSRLVVFDAGNPITFDTVNFVTSTSSSDYLGEGLELRGKIDNTAYQITLKNILLSSGPNQVTGVTSAPILYCNYCGITSFDNFSMNRRGIAFRPGQGGSNAAVFPSTIRVQGGITPFLTSINNSGATIGITYVANTIQLDTMAQPLFTNLGSTTTNLTLSSFTGPGSDGVSNPPLISGVSTCVNGSSPFGYTCSIQGGNFSNNTVIFNGTLGSSGYMMSQPSAPTVGTPTAGGSIPSGTVNYEIAAVDSSGNISVLSNAGTQQTTGAGNNTILITPPTLPVGAVAWRLYRSTGGGGYVLTAAVCGTPNQSPGVAYTDSANGTCGGSTPSVFNALARGISSTGIFSDQFKIVNNGFAMGLTGTPTANRTITFPDNTGTVAELNLAQTFTAQNIFNGGGFFAGGINAQVGTSYVVLSSDENKLLTFSNASPVAVTLAQATTPGFGSGAIFHVINRNSGNVTITPTTSTINGSATLVITNGQSYDIYSDGSNYFALGGASAGGSGITTLDTLTAATQTFSTPNSDANVGITITPSGSNHAFLATWTGTLAKARTLATTVYTDQTNSYTSSNVQTFGGGSLFNGGINAQVGTTYTVLTTDNGKLTTFANASPVAVTLAQANTSGFTNGSVFNVKNLGPGTVTITPTTSTIDGAATLVVNSGSSFAIWSNGTNYFSVGGGAGGSGTINSCATIGGNAYYAAAGTTISCDASVTDSGTGTLTASTLTGSGTNGGIDATEGTGASLTPAAGHDLLFANSSTHRWNQNLNNGTNDTVLGAATVDTLTNKTFNTSGPGNVFQIAGLGITAVTGTTGRVTTSGVSSPPVSAKCAEFDTNGNLQIAGSNAACGAGGGSSVLSALTAATGANTIASGANGAQIWNWALNSNINALQIGETTAATSGTLGSQYILSAKSISGSTAVPFGVIDSLSGSQTRPSLHITPTWNTSGVVDAALLINPTNTASGTGSLLIDAQLGGTSQWKVDKAGNTTQLGGINTGASPPNCTPASGGFDCIGEGTAPTNASSTTAIYADSTRHELKIATNGTSNFGNVNRAMPGAIRSTGLTAAVTTATLCAASAGACNVSGEYHIHASFYQSGTACATNVTGGITPTITWTDGNGTAHSAVPLPMITQSSATALSTTMLFNQTGSGLGTVFATADFNVDTNGSVIQYSIGYANCSGSGTGTYAASLVVTAPQ